MNEINELTWMNRHERIETNELKRMNWNEWFADLIFKKWSDPVRFFRFLYFVVWDRARAHFVAHSPDRAAKPRKQTPSSSDHGQPLYPKKHRVLRTRSRSVTLPNYLMMMWLAWWCGWHDDWYDDGVAMMVRQLAIDNRPYLGSFPTKLPLINTYYIHGQICRFWAKGRLLAPTPAHDYTRGAVSTRLAFTCVYIYIYTYTHNIYIYTHNVYNIYIYMLPTYLICRTSLGLVYIQY